MSKDISNSNGSVTINFSTTTLIKVAALVLALFFLWFVRDIVALVFVALIFAALIDPLADWFSKKRIPRALAVLIIYAVLLALLVSLILLLIPAIMTQFGELVENTTFYWDNVRPYFEQVLGYVDLSIAEIEIEKALEPLTGNISTAASAIFGTITGIVTGVAAVIIVLVITFYMVAEEDTARKFYRTFAPTKYHPYIAEALTEIKHKFGAWLRGELLMAFIVGTLSYVALSILGVNHALLLAIIIGLAEFVPYLGPIVGATLAVFIAFADSPLKALLVLIIFILIQQLEAHLLYPKVMQKAVGLNPIISIIALLIGAKVAGIIGVLLAVPVATAIGVVIQEFYINWKEVKTNVKV